MPVNHCNPLFYPVTTKIYVYTIFQFFHLLILMQWCICNQNTSLEKMIYWCTVWILEAVQLEHMVSLRDVGMQRSILNHTEISWKTYMYNHLPREKYFQNVKESHSHDSLDLRLNIFFKIWLVIFFSFLFFFWSNSCWLLVCRVNRDNTQTS